MLDIAWPELVVIGAVALVAIGPKDLPKAMALMGKWVGKARRFAHDVHRAIEQVSYEAEVAEKLKKNGDDLPPAKDTRPDAMDHEMKPLEPTEGIAHASGAPATETHVTKDDGAS